MGVDCGENGGTSPPPEFGAGDSPPPTFCHVAKFYAPDYLHYNVGKCVFASTAGLFIVSPAMSPPRQYAISRQSATSGLISKILEAA